MSAGGGRMDTGRKGMSECSTCASAGTCNLDSCEEKEPLTEAQKASHVKNLVVVMSGKGGVGKSSVTSLLAVGLHRQGYKVGILDADITGPSIPRLFGVKARVGSGEFGMLPPESRRGIKIMSINLLLEKEDDPVIWRGAILTQVVQQFWTDVVWGELDYLLVDLPPGTGDIPITVFQSYPVNGIVVVTSPQQLTHMVVRKAVNMARKYELPILGLIENMAYVECTDCHKRIEVFGAPGGQAEAERSEIPFLGELPIDPAWAQLADAGQVESYEGKAFLEVVARLEDRIRGDR